VRAYLFAWNKKLFPWSNHQEIIEQLAAEGKATIRWSCGNTKVIAPGDRMFLIKIGSQPKGMVASGFITKAPFYDVHWKDKQQQTLFVEAELDCLFNPDTEPILGLGILATGNLGTQRWTPQSSGISIKPNLIDELEAVWYDFLSTAQTSKAGFFRQASESTELYLEGSANQVTLTKYERNPYARKACLEHYGYVCVVCGFDFERTYGVLGKEFIHVHHLKPLAHIGKEYAVDPTVDLRPVCANCHAMLHRTKAGISIADLRAQLDKATNRDKTN